MRTRLAIYAKHRTEAEAAFRVFADMCGGKAPPRVPGMDTVIRLALRIDCGRTIEEAAGREYLYRWHLAILPPDQCVDGDRLARNAACSCFGTPHTIGM